MEILDEREVDVVLRLFWWKQTHVEVAREVGVCVGSVPQIRDRALRKLKDPFWLELWMPMMADGDQDYFVPYRRYIPKHLRMEGQNEQ